MDNKKKSFQNIIEEISSSSITQEKDDDELGKQSINQ